MVIKWLKSNLLTLNFDKTAYIPFHIRQNSAPHKTFSITAHTCFSLTSPCSCPSLTRADNIKYLGVQIDTGLRWDKQINALTNRILRLIHVFKSLRESADTDTLKMVFYALCQSVIGYCITVWGGASKTSLIRVERAQRAILKVMLRRPFRYETTQLYADCQILTVRQLFVLRTILRRHTSILPSNTKTRTTIIPGARHKTSFARHHYYTLSTHIYKKANKYLNIIDLNKHNVKAKLTEWLLLQDYSQTEALLTYIN